MVTILDRMSARSRSRDDRRLRRSLLLLLIVPSAFLLLLFAREVGGLFSSKATTRPGDGASSVAMSLIDNWRIYGDPPSPEDGDQLTQLFNSTAGQLNCVNNLMIDYHWNGEYLAYFECEVAPPLAADLIGFLNRSPSLEQKVGFDRTKEGPDWWPTKWPPDIRWFFSHGHYLGISENGGRLWFVDCHT